jgi:hypothetical protein
MLVLQIMEFILKTFTKLLCIIFRVNCIQNRCDSNANNDDNFKPRVVLFSLLSILKYNFRILI